jgi:hypothetical protein
MISYHISYHIISYHISYHIISYHIITYHIISYHIISIISYHISYHIISYHISYHIISYRISYHIISTSCYVRKIKTAIQTSKEILSFVDCRKLGQRWWALYMNINSSCILMRLVGLLPNNLLYTHGLSDQKSSNHIFFHSFWLMRLSSTLSWFSHVYGVILRIEYHFMWYILVVLWLGGKVG